MVSLFLILSFLAAFGGFVFLTKATMGVGIICLAAVLGIYARIIQAHIHHQRRRVTPETPERSGG